ncbi:hypothetical protein BDZ45DRAFT_379194 [Acephala macrosclerotiorum]|nr:hypothetical protein BDZ45DRAFT_379194 [Acephala macrosclerotiorum]
MASPAQQNWRYAQQVEAALRALMSGQAFPLYEEIEDLIKQLRVACEATIFLNFEYATTTRIGQKLWDAHVLINNRYRKMVDGFKKPDKKQHVVERRKLEKHYVDFLKTSQHFYKGYIQRLASHFSGMQNLRRIAHRLSLETLSADERVHVTPEVQGLIEASCHSTLLRLGDLSRYRNQIRTKDRSWDPAMGYYALANDLCPDKGSAHNQMAVIALADGNHLDAVYHLFRAIAVKEPHPLAEGNLEIEFKKIIKQKRLAGKNDSLSTLVWWFVLLHARFHEGQEFSTRQELEKEVLSRLTILLKEQSFGDVLEKIVIISIAAESFAAHRLSNQAEEATVEAKNSYFFCLEFNVRMLFVLLQVLLPELDQDLSGEEIPTNDTKPEKPRETITAVARRVLPALRQYSAWLAGGAEVVLAACAWNPVVKLHSKEMWNMYAIVLTKLLNVFPAGELPGVNYLLEEDETTVGFEPLRKAYLSPECDLFTDAVGVPKVRCTDPGVDRHHPNVEMQSRIRDILLTAACLESKEAIPIVWKEANGQHSFTYTDDDIPLTSPPALASPPQSDRPASSLTAQTPTTASFSPEKMSGWSSHDANAAESVSGVESMDIFMRDMVENLVERPSNGHLASNETSYGMHSLTANEIFAPIASNGVEAQPRLQSTPKMLPSLTGLYNSAFTPQAHELQATSPNRPGTARELSPFSLSTREDRLAAAAALDEMTGYSTSKTGSGSWGRNSQRPKAGSLQRPVSEILQESLAQQYLPYSSAFTDSSSLYGNTPHTRNRPSGDYSKGNIFNTANGNSTTYAGASDFDRTTMLQSSLWNGNQPGGWSQHVQTPPGGQGG